MKKDEDLMGIAMVKPLTWDCIPDEPVNIPVETPPPAPAPSNVLQLPVLNAECMTPPEGVKKDTGKKKKNKTDREHAEDVIGKSFRGIENIIHDGTEVRVWGITPGLWDRISDWELRRRILEVVDDRKLSASRVNSITALIKAKAYRRESPFKKAHHFINVRNGVLFYENKMFVMKNHAREQHCTTQIPWPFDPNAQCDRWDKFLHEIFENDPDQADKIMLVYQIIGYCLLSFCPFEKFFLMVGNGANGKSVIMEIVKSLVGIENVASVQPGEFENRFQRGHLHGKLVNLVTEIAEGTQIADAQLKAITSGELTTAEHKGQAPFEFEAYATCVFATNHLPSTRDFSDALFRRAIILKFNRVFREEEQDKFLKQRLTSEIPGILYRSIRALEDVFAFGFSEPASSKHAKNEWRVEVDQAAQFFEETCIRASGKTIESARLYDLYVEWARAAGIHKFLNRKNFSSRLLRLGGIGTGKGARGVRLLTGLEFSGTSQDV